MRTLEDVERMVNIALSYLKENKVEGYYPNLRSRIAKKGKRLIVNGEKMSKEELADYFLILAIEEKIYLKNLNEAYWIVNYIISKA